ncbi:MAG: hypothetical protein PHX68_02325 [Alphaproteobacteria bacterium]|nr:hypothetical protein [Alphaproteobacteria bacterium]
MTMWVEEAEQAAERNMQGLPFSRENMQIYYKGVECALRFEYLAMLQKEVSHHKPQFSARLRQHLAMDAAQRTMQAVRERTRTTE